SRCSCIFATAWTSSGTTCGSPRSRSPERRPGAALREGSEWFTLLTRSETRRLRIVPCRGAFLSITWFTVLTRPVRPARPASSLRHRHETPHRTPRRRGRRRAPRRPARPPQHALEGRHERDEGARLPPPDLRD